MKHFFCELILSCIVASPAGKPLDELAYGSMLYSYYQQDYQQALLQTMVAEAQGRRGEDVVRFDLAGGSFAFSERMYETARRTFAAVDPTEMTRLDRMRLGFHLARQYHRRGDYDRMAAELEHINLGESRRGRSRVHPEVEFMRAEAAIANGDYPRAELLLDVLDDSDPLLGYGLFNLGVAYREGDQPGAAFRVFERLAQMTGEDPETRDLVQRARLALAFIAREQHATADAARVLDDLPGTGRYRDDALASYGDLAMANEDYELAARIWLTLQNQEYWTSSTAQARLAFPVSLERLASRDMALEQYRQAEVSFEGRLELLSELSQQARDPRWVKSLLMVFSSPEQDDQRMAELVTRWRQQLGHTDWLEWLATEDTHQVLVEWRELLTMQEWLRLLPRELGAFEQVAFEQRRRGAAARGLLTDGELLEQRSQLQQHIQRQAADLRLLESSGIRRTADWMLKLATAEEQALIIELDRSRTLIGHLDAAERDGWLGRVDRLEGLIFWQVANDSAVRIRQRITQHQANVSLLEDVDDRLGRVADTESRFVAGVETDFLAFADRSRVLTTEVDTALNLREVALAGELRNGMAREMKEVQKYLLATRIGIARATDQLALDADTAEGE